MGGHSLRSQKGNGRRNGEGVHVAHREERNGEGENRWVGPDQLRAWYGKKNRGRVRRARGKEGKKENSQVKRQVEQRLNAGNQQ